VVIDLMQDKDVIWHLRGKVKLSAQIGTMSLRFNLNFEKDVDVQGAKVDNIIAHDMQPFKGEVGKLFSTSLQDMYNPSYISLEDIGPVTFDLLIQGVKVGEASIANFGLKAGSNLNIPTTVVLMQNQSAPDKNATELLNEFFSNWMIGMDQILQLQGPTKSVVSYLMNTFSNNVTVKGASDTRLVIDASLADLASVTQTAYNPLNIAVTQTGMYFSVWAQNDLISWGACPASYQLADLFNNDLNPIPARSYQNVSMQLVSPGNICNSARSVAATCLLYHSNNTRNFNNFTTRIAGRLQLQIENFTMQVEYSQRDIPLYFDFDPAIVQGLLCARPVPAFFKYPICFQREGFTCYEDLYWMTHPNPNMTVSTNFDGALWS